MNIGDDLGKGTPALQDLTLKVFYLPLKNLRPTFEEFKQLPLDSFFEDIFIDDRASVKSSANVGSSLGKNISSNFKILTEKVSKIICSQNKLSDNFALLRDFVKVNFKGVANVLDVGERKWEGVVASEGDKSKDVGNVKGKQVDL
uniref:Uncharacterized protein n=1 Tax=Cannabis sativa TaxID=3483 RepID=A0A803NWK6_CANSA